MNKIQELKKKNLISPPLWLPENIMYETYMGSEAYGVSSADSDRDVYGFCIPPKSIVFPHLSGHIFGFGKDFAPFWQYQAHHIYDRDALGGKGVEYDITIYSIVKYFQLCMENNPNMIDSLFTPDRCVITHTRVWEMIKEQRCIFLHAGCWHKFKGYAYSQLHKIRTKNPEGKRKKIVEKYGYDVKYSYHLVRLLLEVEQILRTGTLVLDRDRETLKGIRRGEWSLLAVEDFFHNKEKALEKAYEETSLPWGPREDEIKQLLLDCLEHHYGNLRKVPRPDKYRDAVVDIQKIIERAL